MARLRALLVAALAGLLLVGAGVPARAGDEDAPPPQTDFETHLFDVSSLTVGRTDFRGDFGPFLPTPDRHPDQENPLFGTEPEEPVRPLGDLAAVIESVKDEVPGPWEAEGTQIAECGQMLLLLRAPRDLCARVAERLARYQIEALPAVVVEAVAFEGDPSAVAGATGLAGAIASGALVPIASARAMGHLFERICGRSGGERAFLADHDVEVATKSAVPDPIVGVVRDGMSLDGRVTGSGSDLVVELQAWIARPAGTRTDRSLQGETIEQPAVDGVMVNATVRVRPGVWSDVQTAAGVTFAIRATVRPFDAAAFVSAPVIEASAWDGSEPALTTDRMDVRDVFVRLPGHRGEEIYVPPSNFTPAEPPGLPEPLAIFPQDTLVEVVKVGVDPLSWEREGARMEVHYGRLLVRNGAGQIEAVRRLVQDIRARGNRPLRHRVTVVTVPEKACRDLLAGDTLDFLDDGGQALLARPGAQIVDRLTLRTYPGQRSAVTGGRMLPYVGDYEVELAEGASIGNPVVNSILLGASLDVLSTYTLDGKAVATEVRWDRSRLREMRRVPTRFGDIEAPSIALQRFRGRTVVPLGGTVLLSASLWEGEATLVLLTVSPD